MKQSEYDKLIQVAIVGGGFIPANENATELLELGSNGEVLTLKNMTARDIKFHRGYFALLKFIYGYLPKKFQKNIVQSVFHRWLQHLKKEYKVIYSFIDEEKIKDIIDYCIDLGISAENASKIAYKFGKTDLLEYESISFGNMNQHKFKEYVKNQLPFIYKNVLGKYFEGDIYNGILETIEEEFKKYLSKL